MALAALVLAAGCAPAQTDVQEPVTYADASYEVPPARSVVGLDAADRPAFLESLGLKEPGLHAVAHTAYKILDLITFLTAGPDECRAWTVKRGAKAPQAAGVIHTDFERGFIKAEVIWWEDLVALGSEAACRAAAKLQIEGKDYVVKDGDVIHFRFNV